MPVELLPWWPHLRVELVRRRGLLRAFPRDAAEYLHRVSIQSDQTALRFVTLMAASLHCT